MRTGFSRGVASLALAAAAVIAVNGRIANAAPLLAVDVNDRSNVDGAEPGSDTQTGFSPYFLGDIGSTSAVTSTNGVTQTVNGYLVTLATAPGGALGIGGTGTIDDRDRDFSFNATTLNIAQVYDDFVFQSQAGGGIRLTVSGGELAANTPYFVSIYSYDHGSPGARTADYVDLNNNNAYVLTTAFAGGVVPPTDDANKYTGVAVTDASGTLSLRGFTTSGTLPGNFINGFEISAVPEPTAALGLIGLAGLLLSRRRGR